MIYVRLNVAAPAASQRSIVTAGQSFGPLLLPFSASFASLLAPVWFPSLFMSSSAL